MRVKLTEKSKRIKKAAKKAQPDQTAERIANIVNAERPVAPVTLRDLVCKEAVLNTASLQREVQSLKAKMEILLVGKAGGGSRAKNKKKPTATKKYEEAACHQDST